MNQGLSKTILVKLAETKLSDSLLLYENKRYSNAYYLGGYAVEFGLKACIAKRMLANVIPDKKLINATYTHNFISLVSTAGLNSDLSTLQDSDNLFQTNWAIAADWSPDIRYDVVDKSTAQYFLTAISDKDHGVLQWIKKYW